MILNLTDNEMRLLKLLIQDRFMPTDLANMATACSEDGWIVPETIAVELANIVDEYSKVMSDLSEVVDSQIVRGTLDISRFAGASVNA